MSPGIFSIPIKTISFFITPKQQKQLYRAKSMLSMKFS
ncbi:hypothetical protein CU003_2289 [Enterococcus faecium]|nr:hypothetical protein [Enterococcus faecium]